MRKAMLKEQSLLEELKAFYRDFKDSLEVYQELEAKYIAEADEALKAVDLTHWDNCLDMQYAFKHKKEALLDEIERLEEIISKFG